MLSRCLLRIASVIVLTWGVAQAGTVLRISLSEAICLALRNNPQLQISGLDRVMSKFNWLVALNEYQPQYALTADWDRYHYSSPWINTLHSRTAEPEVSWQTPLGTRLGAGYQIAQNDNGASSAVLLEAEQPLLRGFGLQRTSANIGSARSAEKISQWQYRQNVMNTVIEVIFAYRQIVVAQAQVRHQEAALADAEATIHRNKALIDAGKLAPNENIQQYAQVAQQRLALSQARTQLASHKRQLLRLLGFNETIKLSLSHEDSIFCEDKFPNLQKSIAIALSHDPSYQMAKYRLKQARAQFILAKDASQWQLNLRAKKVMGSNQGVNALQRAVQSDQVGLSLEVPIENYHLKQTVLNAQVQLKQARIHCEAQEKSLRLSVTDAYERVSISRQQIQEARVALQLAEKSLTLEKAKFDLGLSSAINITQLRTQVLNARMSLSNSKIEYQNNISLFRRLLGVILEDWHIQIHERSL